MFMTDRSAFIAPQNATLDSKRTLSWFVSYRRLSSQFKFSLSAVTLGYLSQWTPLTPAPPPPNPLYLFITVGLAGVARPYKVYFNYAFLAVITSRIYPFFGTKGEQNTKYWTNKKFVDGKNIRIIHKVCKCAYSVSHKLLSYHSTPNNSTNSYQQSDVFQLVFRSSLSSCECNSCKKVTTGCFQGRDYVATYPGLQLHDLTPTYMYFVYYTLVRL